jgi:metal-dependent amidase/aminoacylase/carboxypeptidase family protein
MSKEGLKSRVLEAIDDRAQDIVTIGEAIWKTPELGFKELTAEFVKAQVQEMGWAAKSPIALTGLKAYLKNQQSPTIGIIGELDAVRCPEHPESEPITGAVHACGHCAQIASMLGAGFGLFFGGKQEFIRLGEFKDIQISLGTHSGSELQGQLGIGGSNNGFIGKLVRYIGLEAHAGGAPQKGINALNAAMLGLMGIHAQRETFREEDFIRVHPIITKGGEIVNNIPADVRLETYVRGRTINAISQANHKVNRALQAGASAIGAEVKILEIPGYMPYHHASELDNLFQTNGHTLVDRSQITDEVHSTGSTDLGDVSCIMPTSSFKMGGCSGAAHGRTFKVDDKYLQYVLPAKLLAMTCVDLLYNNAEEATKIISSFTPTVSPNNYVDTLHNIAK